MNIFSGKIRLDVSSESSARQRIHMKNQALFSLKDKSKKSKCRLQQFLFGALRVKKSDPLLHMFLWSLSIKTGINIMTFFGKPLV